VKGTGEAKELSKVKWVVENGDGVEVGHSCRRTSPGQSGGRSLCTYLHRANSKYTNPPTRSLAADAPPDLAADADARPLRLG